MRTNPAALGALARGDIENFFVATSPGGIERQEKQGQATLVNSSRIPIEMRPDRAAFEKQGFVFGDAVDDLFIEARLPPGWTKAATDHSMHSKIVDAQGRERVSVFYKAAFYDRRADCGLLPRFTVETQYSDLPGGEALAEDQVCIVVKDGGKEIHRMAPRPQRGYDVLNVDRETARAWLTNNRPSSIDPYRWD